MSLSYQDKRVIDAEITKRFLEDNKNIVKKLVGNFASCMNTEGFCYYLKGGNAIAILNGVDEGHLSGDFDFQLQLSAQIYANWGGNFDGLNLKLVNILKNTVDNTAVMEDAGSFKLDCFQTETIRELARAKGIELGRIRRSDRHNDIMYIGKRYGGMPYTGIIEAGGGQRIEGTGIVEKADVQFSDAGREFGPSAYVNYTIPGFILYRMVYSYSYEMGGETFNLKSEIIDLSIPRPGSAEVYLSQEGVVTYFRHSGIEAYPFRIPGWGYHFYENLNLLQEIELGISGSADKRQKRIDRLNMAMDILKKANGRNDKLENILQLEINEPWHNNTYKAPYRRIRGYFGALAFPVSEYGGAYQQAAISYMQGKVYNMIQSYYSNLCGLWQGKYKDWERLVFFRINSKIDQAFHKAVDVKYCVTRFIAKYSWPEGRPGMRAGMKLGKHYQFISPLLENNEFYFPFDLIVVQIAAKSLAPGVDLYSAFKEYCKRTQDGRFTDFGDEKNAFTYVVNEAADSRFRVKRTYGVIFQKYDGGELPDAKDKHLKDFLTRSILESQRYPLARLLESGG